MTRTRVVIQSRLNSSRLPGKALLTVAGMPLIELVARRATRSGHEVVVATSAEHYDQRIADHLDRVGIPVVRGSLDDVLGRFVEATADLDPGDTVVRLTGDNPVGDASLIDELAAAMAESGIAYGRNDVSHMPEGLGCEVFSIDDLRRAAASTQDPYDREHVTPWLRRNVPTLDYVPEDSPGDPLRYRCTVDVLADYDRVCRLFAGLSDPIGTPWQTIMAQIDEPAFTAGPSVPTRAGSGLSVVGVGGRDLAEAADPAQTRALLATAVIRGVNHVEIGRGDGTAEATLHDCGEPQLTRRLAVISRLTGVRGDTAEAAALSVEASLERTFAELGRRAAASALLPSLEDALAADGAAWQRLEGYRADGLVDRIGVCLQDRADVDAALALPGLGHLQVPLSLLDARFGDLTPALADLDVAVTTHGTYAGGRLLAADHPRARDLADLAARFGRAGVADLALGYVLAHDFVTSVAVGARSVEQMVENLELATRAPLSAQELSVVRAELSRRA